MSATQPPADPQDLNRLNQAYEALVKLLGDVMKCAVQCVQKGEGLFTREIDPLSKKLNVPIRHLTEPELQKLRDMAVSFGLPPDETVAYLKTLWRVEIKEE